MSSSGFYLFMLVIFVALLQAYSFFKGHFSGLDEYKARVVVLEKQVRTEKTKTQIAQHQMESLKQEVAELLPGAIDSRQDYRIRNLASVTQTQEPITFDSSAKLLESGKTAYSNKKFSQAIAKFKELIETFPESKEIVEAYFLLAETYVQVQMVEDATDVIEVMIQLFPESELTGFAMVRLSGIYVQRQLEDEAVEILQTVRHNFSYNRDLVEQCNQLLKRLER